MCNMHIAGNRLDCEKLYSRLVVYIQMYHLLTLFMTIYPAHQMEAHCPKWLPGQLPAALSTRWWTCRVKTQRRFLSIKTWCKKRNNDSFYFSVCIVDSLSGVYISSKPGQKGHCHCFIKYPFIYRESNHKRSVQHAYCILHRYAYSFPDVLQPRVQGQRNYDTSRNKPGLKDETKIQRTQ